VKKVYAISIALLVAAPLAGCYSPEERALGGALLGGATGAAIGAATTGRASGAAVGGAIGAASGAVIGASTTPTYYEPGYRQRRVYAAPQRVYVQPEPVYVRRQACWTDRRPVVDRWGRVVAYERVRVCQ